MSSVFVEAFADELDKLARSGSLSRYKASLGPSQKMKFVEGAQLGTLPGRAKRRHGMDRATWKDAKRHNLPRVGSKMQTQSILHNRGRKDIKKTPVKKLVKDVKSEIYGDDMFPWSRY